jgi:hypothetical protein
MAEMPAPMLDEWRAFYMVHPWGERRADLRSGIIASMLSSKKRATPADFMPDFDRPPRAAAMSDENMKQVAGAFFRSVRKRRGGPC